jgi:hypothetical protein
VDALDEAGSESAQKLAAYFHRLVDRADRKKLTLQICISCQHYLILESARARAIHFEYHNKNEIATYIKDMVLETDVEDVPSQRDERSAGGGIDPALAIPSNHLRPPNS